ncbi:leader peptidase (prepilin peptidase)/N-methyltransferase [Clostridiales Family XIII bacterium PM5-7]
MIGEGAGITIYILVVSGIFGAVLGSFINCMAWRIAHEESVLKGRSHCAVCDHPLGGMDLIPLVSYIMLKGRCRYCKEKISSRYFIAELICAVTFMLIAYRFDVSWLALRYLVLACMLLGLSLVDLEIYEIPDRFIIGGILWWAATLPMLQDGWKDELVLGLIGGFAIAGSMLLLAMLFDKITGKESLGGGDIKLFFMTGLYLGPWVGLLNLMLACFLGILFVVLSNEKKIPFGPAISMAVIISILVGKEIVGWYLNLF